MHCKHAVPAVTTGALLAAAFAAAPAFASAVTPPAGNDAVQPPAQPDTLAAIQDVAHVRPLVTRIVHASAQKTYTVVSGDTLAGIAGQFCGSAGKWPSLNHGNHAQLKDPNLIYPGQKLVLSCDDPALMPVTTDAVVQTRASNSASSSASSAPVHRDADQASCTPNCPWGDGDGDSMDMDHSPFQSQSAPASSDSEGGSSSSASQAPAPVSATVTGVSSGGGNVNPASFGGYEACVISRESGGNSQVMNSSGHYGLFQFSASTWQAYGGNPGDFGHASAAEQEAVFNTAMAQGGQSNWSPYDGC